GPRSPTPAQLHPPAPRATQSGEFVSAHGPRHGLPPTLPMIQFTPEPGVPHPFDAFVRRLLEADWESTTGPMRFSASLTLSDLADAAFLHNTRVLMAGLAAEQGTPATATGNLTRAFVGKLLDRVALPTRSRESIRAVCKVVNELDLWPLHLARVVA